MFTTSKHIVARPPQTYITVVEQAIKNVAQDPAVIHVQDVRHLEPGKAWSQPALVPYDKFNDGQLGEDDFVSGAQWTPGELRSGHAEVVLAADGPFIKIHNNGAAYAVGLLSEGFRLNASSVGADVESILAAHESEMIELIGLLMLEDSLPA